MSVTAPKGFLVGTAATGKRASGQDDVCVIYSERTASAAGVFTSNQMAAPPVVLAKRAVADGALKAIVVNAGNANACTGDQGRADAERMVATVASALEVEPDDVAVASTGVIGVPLEMAALDNAIRSACDTLSADNGLAGAKAIMTTDNGPKTATASVTIGGQAYVVGGMAKGAGMICPDMATMLCFLTTDAPMTHEACEQALLSAVGASFNKITVDGETSTNDCVLLMANGAAGGAAIATGGQAYESIAQAITQVCAELAKMIVRDGEGATKLVEVVVRGAVDDTQAHIAAMAVAVSPLFKCAMYGSDPNWGRVVSAVGASRAKVDPDSIEVLFAGIQVASAGTAVPFDEADAKARLDSEDVQVVVDLHLGDGQATVWTCDLTYEYVRINADYRT